LPINIDDSKKTLVLEWHDVYDLDMYVHYNNKYLLLLNLHSKTGEYQAIKGDSYPAKNARVMGNAFLQEAVSQTHYSSEILLIFRAAELCQQWNYGDGNLW
jgi:hypothetical protein